MKKFFVVLTLSAFMFACNNSGDSSNEPADQPAVEQAEPTPAEPADTNSVQDSLNVNANSDSTQAPAPAN